MALGYNTVIVKYKWSVYKLEIFLYAIKFDEITWNL